MSDLYYFAMAANILAALEEKGNPRIVMARALRLAKKPYPLVRPPS
jgi:hypothetical protein